MKTWHILCIFTDVYLHSGFYCTLRSLASTGFPNDLSFIFRLPSRASCKNILQIVVVFFTLNHLSSLIEVSILRCNVTNSFPTLPWKQTLETTFSR